VPRLFLKVFLWFWATVILVGIALVLSFVFSPRGSYLPWQDARRVAGTLVKEMDRHGPGGATQFLSRLERSQGLEACLYDKTGTPIAGNHCAAFEHAARGAAALPAEPNSSGVYRNVVRLRSANGREYILATELPYGPGQVHHTIFGFAVHWLVVLLVSSAICYLLTLRLTRPILRLREASRQISEGNLHARVSGGAEGRGDEFGDLARDFNAMADRIENLLSSQRQLISDVSHELRSPLTRMQLAVDLMRKRGGDDAALDRMQTDLERLEHLIARLLTVARVEAGAAAAKWERIDLTGLLTEIAADAQIEAREKNCSVVFREAKACMVTGDEYLLRSALENVVRNAVYYTSPGTEVLIMLAPSEDATKMIVLEISDQGPGVPEAELPNIFRPFYRVGQARDLQSGGAGLGLAIASRVIQLHRGTIAAGNRPTGGLTVTIQLPQAS